MSAASRNPCPHCGAYCRVRTSKPVSDTSREKFYQCTNDQCGYEFRSVESILTTIRQSLNPNPSVNIPRFPRGNKPRPVPTG